MQRIVLVIATFLIITPILTIHTSYAAAPPALVPQTGQTTCFDTTGTITSCSGNGQDGELQIGVAWPNQRFTDNNDESVTDKLTGLIWAKDANLMITRDPTFDAENDGAVTWQHALDYVNILNTENYLGYNDWRLPNIHELGSLINLGQSQPATWLNDQGFSNVQTNFYWTSTTYASGTSNAWCVNVEGSIEDFDDKVVSYYVWPVRGGLWSFGSLSLSKTGQTDCYNTTGDIIACNGTGQDGELQSSMAWPTPRFTDNSLTDSTDSTVTDGLTGLVWSKNANPAAATKTWQQALDYIDNLNITNYQGQRIWRLPNRNELATLINMGQAHSNIWLNEQGFSNVQTNSYWSSSTHANDTSSAWEVSMDNGYMTNGVKTYGFSVWPVRDGDSFLGSLGFFVVKSGTGSGTVASSTDSINCGSVCNAYIDSGNTVTLTATPDNGSTFTGWTGACSGTGTCTTTMDVAKSVTATFTILPTTVKPGDCDNSGTVSIAEVQSAINMFLGLKAAEVCVNQDGAGGVSIAEVQKVINSFLGL